MAISEKQLLANRANSLKARGKCTGPKDFSRTRYNAIRHEMTSKFVIIPGESQEEFEVFLQGIKDCMPATNESADEIVLCLWSLKRGRKAESEIVAAFADTESIRWDDLLKSGYLQRIAKHERRAMNKLKRLVSEFVDKNSA